MNITDELLEKYHLAPINEYSSAQEFYYAFLSASDYEMVRMFEDYISGDSKTVLKNRYGEILELRKAARVLAKEYENE